VVVVRLGAGFIPGGWLDTGSRWRRSRRVRFGQSNILRWVRFGFRRYSKRLQQGRERERGRQRRTAGNVDGYSRREPGMEKERDSERGRQSGSARSQSSSDGYSETNLIAETIPGHAGLTPRRGGCLPANSGE
jgi:hypothetical protein